MSNFTDSVKERNHDPRNVDRGEFLGTLEGEGLWSGVAEDRNKLRQWQIDRAFNKLRKFEMAEE